MRSSFHARRLPTILVGLCLLAAPRARADRAEYWRHMSTAVGEIVEGELVAAVITLKEARAAHNSPEVDLLVGLAALAGGRVKDASAMFDRSIASGGTQPLAFYWAARAAFAARRYALSRRRLQQALAAGGDLPAVHMAIALLETNRQGRRARQALLRVAGTQGNLLDPQLYPTAAQGAVELLRSALHDVPDGQRVTRTQGHLYWRLGLVLSAKRRFEKLLKRKPRDADALQMLARCQQALGATDEAIELARRAVALDGQLALARATLGQLLMAAGKRSEAVAELRKAADSRPDDPNVVAALAEACAQAHDDDCAARYFRYALRRDPRLGSAQIGLAIALQNKGQLTAAEQAIRRGVQLDPVNPRAYQVWAQIARLRGERRTTSRALDFARRARAEQARFDRRERRARQVISATQRALTRCGVETGPADPACSAALRGLARPIRALLRAHLLSAAHPAAASRELSMVLKGLRSRRLLTGDPTHLAVRSRLAGGTYEVRRVLPMVVPSLAGVR